MLRPTLLALLMAAHLSPAAAQDSTFVAGDRPNQITIDAQILGATIGYARRISPTSHAGATLGLGGHLIEYMALAGRHFSEDSGLAYEERDAGTNPLVYELLSVGGFVRRQQSERWQVELGVRASAFFHFDSTDDEPGGGAFVGVYVLPMYGWRRLKFGPRAMAGVFTEGRGRTEFGVHLAPLTARMQFDF
jgi:hypothetical protein